jgi:hypothetical protein
VAEGLDDGLSYVTVDDAVAFDAGNFKNDDIHGKLSRG